MAACPVPRKFFRAHDQATNPIEATRQAPSRKLSAAGAFTSKQRPRAPKWCTTGAAQFASSVDAATEVSAAMAWPTRRDPPGPKNTSRPLKKNNLMLQRSCRQWPAASALRRAGAVATLRTRHLLGEQRPSARSPSTQLPRNAVGPVRPGFRKKPHENVGASEPPAAHGQKIASVREPSESSVAGLHGGGWELCA